MGYYLQMDGVDDYIKTNAALTFTDVIIDAYPTPASGTFKDILDEPSIKDVNNFTGKLEHSGNNSMTWHVYSSVKINGTSAVSGSTVFPVNQRCTIQATLASAGTSLLYFFCNSGLGAIMPGNVYDIKVYNGATLVAHYDFTSTANISGQTVLDQSGNGNNATLNGGTPVFVSDGATGTTGSASYATKQQISQTVSSAYATQQTINQTSSASYATKQILSQSASSSYATQQTINQSGTFAAATKQTINQTSSTDAATKQVISQATSASYATEQDITDGGIPGSISYATKQTLYAVNAAAYATKQSLSQTGAASYATKQAVYAFGSIYAASKQMFYLASASIIATKQTIYQESNKQYAIKISIYSLGTVVYPLAQSIYDPSHLIVSRVKLLSERNMRVKLYSSRDLRVKLRSDVSMAMEKQDFNMDISESKCLDFEATDNGAILPLTGATLTFVMKSRITDTTPLITKDSTGADVTITDAANGLYTVKLNPDDTKNFAPGIYFYAIKVKDVSGLENPITKGSITLELSGF